jgi:hypothetical protein
MFTVAESDGILQLGSHSTLVDVGFLWKHLWVTAPCAGSEKGQEKLIVHRCIYTSQCLCCPMSISKIYNRACYQSDEKTSHVLRLRMKRLSNKSPKRFPNETPALYVVA